MCSAATGHPECQKHFDVFEVAEAAVRRGLGERWSTPDIAADDAVSAQLSWCRRCSMAPECLADMAAAGYTGIAGGVILHHGRPYVPSIDAENGRPCGVSKF